MKGRVGVVAVGVAAAVAYSSFLASYFLGAGRGVEFVSELERAGAPYAGWYRACDVAAGVLMLGLVALCWPRQDTRAATRWAVYSVAVLGVGSILDGASSMDCASSVHTACAINDHSVTGLLGQLLVGHTLSGLAGFAAAGFGAACCAHASWSQSAAWPAAPPAQPGQPVWAWVYVAVAVGIGVCGLTDLALLLGHGDIDLVERTRILFVSAWIATFSWTAARPRDPRPNTDGIDLDSASAHETNDMLPANTRGDLSSGSVRPDVVQVDQPR